MSDYMRCKVSREKSVRPKSNGLEYIVEKVGQILWKVKLVQLFRNGLTIWFWMNAEEELGVLEEREREKKL